MHNRTSTIRNMWKGYYLLICYIASIPPLRPVGCPKAAYNKHIDQEQCSFRQSYLNCISLSFSKNNNNANSFLFYVLWILIGCLERQTNGKPTLEMANVPLIYSGLVEKQGPAIAWCPACELAKATGWSWLALGRWTLKLAWSGQAILLMLLSRALLSALDKEVACNYIEPFKTTPVSSWLSSPCGNEVSIPLAKNQDPGCDVCDMITSLSCQTAWITQQLCAFL